MMKTNILYLISFIFISIASFIYYLVYDSGSFLFWLNMHHTEPMDVFFKYLTFLGDGLFFAVIAVIVLFKDRKIGFVFALMGILQSLISWILKHKVFTNSPRPKGVYTTDFINLVEDVTVHSHHSFPSGHTMTAFSIATFLALWINHKGIAMLFFVLACLVAVSRIYLFQHFLIDTICGAVIGVILGYLGMGVLPFFKKK